MTKLRALLATLSGAALLVAATLLVAPTQTEAAEVAPSCTSGLGDGGLSINWRHIPDEISRLHLRRDGEWLRVIQGSFEPDENGTLRGYTLDNVFPEQGRYSYQLRYRIDGELTELDCGIAQTIQNFIGNCTVTRTEATATVRIDLTSQGIDRWHVRAVDGAWQTSFDTRINDPNELVFVDTTPEDAYLVRFRAGRVTAEFDDVFENVCAERDGV